MSPAAVAQVFLEEFGEPPRKLFAEWSPTPFAAASIGQVHRARLASGEEVAVKVQYPEVVAAIDADLRSAAIFDRLSSLLFRGQERGAFMAELRERFTEECDYRIEAANQEEFRRRWAGRAGRAHSARVSRAVAAARARDLPGAGREPGFLPGPCHTGTTRSRRAAVVAVLLRVAVPAWRVPRRSARRKFPLRRRGPGGAGFRLREAFSAAAPAHLARRACAPRSSGTPPPYAGS